MTTIAIPSLHSIRHVLMGSRFHLPVITLCLFAKMADSCDAGQNAGLSGEISEAHMKANGLAALSARLNQSTPRVVCENANQQTPPVIDGEWREGIWSGSIRNTSSVPVVVREVVLFEGQHGLDPSTRIYGESFQMLAQITGTLGSPADLGMYTDRSHYRIPEPDGYRTASGLLTLNAPGGDAMALAFTSCHKFIGRIGFNSSRLKIFIETEGLTLAPNATWKLESFGCFAGKNRDAAMLRVAQAIKSNHPCKLPDAVPTGWCSWYTFFEEITVEDIRSNLRFAKENLPKLRYIQIDDGYEAKMGDWLVTGTAFGGDVREVIKEIKQAGFEPAIWVAPFIAEKSSAVFQQHPDWFIQGPDGKPLDSSSVGFGGWRCAPWYVLDGTHPAVQQHLQHVFKTMREEWGVTYFKLDANYWGAIHGGKHHDPGATRIDAYRQGMTAIRRGAGDAFILGCNAPIWPSFGLVDGMRTSGDISQKWKEIKSCGMENLSRSWQNGVLWWNDPDCVLLTERTQKNIRKGQPAEDPTITDKEFKLHVATIRATGGMVLSGDEMTQITPGRLAVLNKLLSPTGKTMHFENQEFEIGRLVLDEHNEEVAMFNWSDQPVRRSISVRPGDMVVDFWSSETKTMESGTLEYEIPARSAVLIQLKKP